MEVNKLNILKIKNLLFTVGLLFSFSFTYNDCYSESKSKAHETYKTEANGEYYTSAIKRIPSSGEVTVILIEGRDYLFVVENSVESLPKIVNGDCNSNILKINNINKSTHYVLKTSGTECATLIVGVK